MEKKKKKRANDKHSTLINYFYTALKKCYKCWGIGFSKTFFFFFYYLRRISISIIVIHTPLANIIKIIISLPFGTCARHTEKRRLKRKKSLHSIVHYYWCPFVGSKPYTWLLYVEWKPGSFVKKIMLSVENVTAIYLTRPP